MTTFGLWWAPPPEEMGWKSAEDQLKYLLAPRLWDHDGSLRSPAIVVGEELILYLEGVKAATTIEDVYDGANRLINAITQYGRIQLRIGSPNE